MSSDLTLILEDKTTGRRLVVPLTEIGGTLRFAVGQRGRRSSVWRVWANTSSHDVYIASRTIAGIQKYSLHASGIWRLAFTSEYMAEVGAGEVDRVIDRWSRPEPDASGVVPGPIIAVRAEDVTDMDDTALGGQIDWVPAPAADEGVFFHTLFLRLGQELSLPPRTMPVGILRLTNDEGFLVAAETAVPSDEQRESLVDARRKAEATLPDEVLKQAGEPGLRLGVFGNYDDGRRYVWDTAF